MHVYMYLSKFLTICVYVCCMYVPWNRPNELFLLHYFLLTSYFGARSIGVITPKILLLGKEEVNWNLRKLSWQPGSHLSSRFIGNH